MYKRILVPLDGSEVAERTLVHAVQMAHIFDTELILLRAVYLAEMPDVDLGEAHSILLKESEADLGEVGGTLQIRGQRLRTDRDCCL